MSIQATWLPTVEASSELSVSKSHLFLLKQRGDLIAGRHYYKATGRKLLWCVDAIRASQIERSIAARQQKNPPETYRIGSAAETTLIAQIIELEAEALEVIK
ncbi:hypothetical protein KBY83_12680 [Cyanobium sp. WKJ7-Wakatipu]|nr:hypothetical protein [Cyanobium sp. WKJ7-Wakatipu]